MLGCMLKENFARKNPLGKMETIEISTKISTESFETVKRVHQNIV